MVRLVCLYGVGDAYLVCSLARAFERYHGVNAKIIVKSGHAAIPQWFGLDHAVDDVMVKEGETDADLQRTHPNDFEDAPPPFEPIVFVHPHFVLTPTRLDQLTVKPRRTSQADMYRALMQLPPDAPMEIPPMRTARAPIGGVFLMRRSNSWPQIDGPFWQALQDRLDGPKVGPVYCPTMHDTLDDMLDAMAASRWIIGPQCGVMSAAIEAGFPGRKTLAIRELSAACPYLFGLTETMPYGHVSTFAGNDHPVDHVIVSPERWQDAIGEICRL